MIPLFDINNINSFNSSDNLPLQCERCNCTFTATQKYIKSILKRKMVLKYCSYSCSSTSPDKPKNITCGQCHKNINAMPSNIKKSKSGLLFCSRSCSAIYNNSHKTTGTRRSKLETWLETKLNILYPNLIILFNNKESINSELDIYIPSLKIAFELNGIFHYEPIYGLDKLNKTQNNDKVKMQACLDNKILLYVIDITKQKNFKESTSLKYLDIITNIINTTGSTSRT